MRLVPALGAAPWHAWRRAFCIAALALAGCSGGSEESTAPAGGPAGEPAPTPAPEPPPPPGATGGAFIVTPARVGLVVGATGTLLALRPSAAVTWSSSDPAVASVDALGQVTALAKGSAVISARSGSELSTSAIKIHADSDATAAALIATALAQSRINAEQALMYRVFAYFGDERLPPQFDGAPATAPSHMLLREVSGRLAQLSAAAQEILLPFLIPPIYAQSWQAQRLGLVQSAQGRAQALALAAGKGRLDTVNCNVAASPAGWLRRSTAHFNIYYLDFERWGTDTEKNSSVVVAAVVEEVYTSLTNLLGRFPVSDLGEPCNGGDGAVDIYLLPGQIDGNIGATTTYPRSCENVASYVTLNTRHPIFLVGAAQRPNDDEVRRMVKAVVAHEFAHVLQFAMDRYAACVGEEYVWLDEATAEWAMDYIDPTFNKLEDGFIKLSSVRSRTGGFLLRYLSKDHLASMEKPGADEGPGEHGYAEYLFFQYLARKYEPEIIKQIFDATTGKASVDAVESALAGKGGMKAVWPDFALTLWNGTKDKVLDYWSVQDRYDYGLANIFEPAVGDRFAPSFDKLKTLQVDQKGEPRATFKLLDNALQFPGTYYEIEPRSLFYEHLKFSDATVRSVLFVNPVAILPNRDFMKVQAVKKIGGVWQPVEDWTAESTKNFCRDKRDERLEELILIVSNSEVNLAAEKPFEIPQMFPMRISTSNVGCWRWVGTASTTKTYDDGAGLSGEITGDAVLRWDVSAVLAGSLHFEPRAGLIDGNASGRLAACTFTEVAERAVLDASAPPTGQQYGRLHMNLDLDLGFGDTPNRNLTAFDGAATMQATRTMVCPSGTVTSAGPGNFTWLQVDSDAVYTVSADGQTLEGEYVAAFPATSGSIRTRFRFRAERE